MRSVGRSDRARMHGLLSARLPVRVQQMREKLDRRFDIAVAALPKEFRRRGAGRGSAIVLLVASLSYGGWLSASDANASPIVLSLADRTGFALSEIEISGHETLDEAAVLDLIGIVPGVALPLIDVDATRQRLIDSPWIASATIRKLYPSRLGIEITEAEPYAIWQYDGHFHVISHDGHPLSEVFARNLPDLPLVVGHNANQRASEILDLVASYPAIAEVASTAVRVADRRWTLKLSPGIDVYLPEHDIEAALDTLVDMLVDDRIADRAVNRIDLRLSDRVVVRLMDELDAVDDEARAGG